MIYLAWATCAVALMDLLASVYRSFDRDHMEGEPYQNCWISWGTVIPLTHEPKLFFRYFLMKLPLFEWVPDCYNCDGPWHQHQFVIHRFNGKWSWGFWICLR